MKYEEPKIHILLDCDEDIVRTSNVEVDPNPVPGQGQDSGAW